MKGCFLGQLDILDPGDAKYVEAQIPQKDLMAFVAEDAEDLNSFLALMTDSRKLRINGVMVPSESLESFKPRVPLNQIK